MTDQIQLNNALRKTVSSLVSARSRREEGLFKAEGTKCVADTIDAFDLYALIATPAWIEEHPEVVAKAGSKVLRTTNRDIERMSGMITPQGVIAVYRIPCQPDDFSDFHGLGLVLDELQDPGNLGTIIRMADWFGIEHIFCSHTTADCYAPKVVQATMGAISRVRLYYVDLPEFLSKYEGDIFGTFLDGENMLGAEIGADGLIVIGNEGHGISPEVDRFVTRRLTIPSYPPGAPTVDSLNAAVAASITVAEFRRRLIQKS